MTWIAAAKRWRQFDRMAQEQYAPWQKLLFRLAIYSAIVPTLAALPWLPTWVTGVALVPLLGGMAIAGGPFASRNARFTRVMDSYGTTLMGISATFAVGALIGLSILSPDCPPTGCASLALRYAVMWWTITTGAWTVIAGVAWMTLPQDQTWSSWARELAGRLVIGTTLAAAVLLVAFGLLFAES